MPRRAYPPPPVPEPPVSKSLRPVINEPMAYRVDAAVQVLGLSRSTLYKLAKQGRIELIRVAGRTLVRKSEVERLIADAAVISFRQ